MANEVTVEQLADDMYELVKDSVGKKKFKPGDLIKEMQAKYGKDTVDKKAGKGAIKLLMDSERCVYSYAGGSYIELAK
ncbi:hypothetical protein KKH56_06320 [bacterium]|nr:hypothetical protein [bacterium]